MAKRGDTLGVLNRQRRFETLAAAQERRVAASIAESEVVFDYAEPFENYPSERRAKVMAVAARAASLGEPWLSLFDPAELAEMARHKGFGMVEDLGLAEISERFYGELKQDIRTGAGPHLVRAQKFL